MDESVALFVLQRDNGCMAPRLGATAMDCWGRNRLEHCKAEPRMSKRAPACPCSLLTLCQGHTEDGMRAGFVWAIANREACRDHLATFAYGPHVEGHAASILELARHERCVDPCSSICPAGVPA